MDNQQQEANKENINDNVTAGEPESPKIFTLEGKKH